MRWVVALAAVMALPWATLANPPAQRQQELNHLLRHDCGSCHGITLQGGLGPPLTPASLSRRTPEQLARIIRDGLPGTPMPPWGALLNAADVDWLARKILRGDTDE